MNVYVRESGECLVGDGLKKEEDRMSSKEGGRQYVEEGKKIRQDVME